MARGKKTPKIYLLFTSFDCGDHSNTIEKGGASALARKIVKDMTQNLGAVVNVDGESDDVVMLNVFDKINRLTTNKFGKNTAYIEYEDGSWSCVTLIDKESIKYIKNTLTD